MPPTSRHRASRYPVAALLVGLVLLGACSDGGGSERGADGDGGPGGTAEGLGNDGPVQEWSWSPPPPNGLGMPAADASGVALTYGRHRLVLLDPTTGDPKWELEQASLRDVAPLLLADLVVVPTEDGLVAADRASGQRRWEADLGGRSNTPVLAAGTLVITTWDGGLFGVDPSTGRVQWRSDLPGDAMGPAAAGPAAGGTVASGTVAVASWDDGRAAGVVAVDAATGRQRWAVPLPADGVSAPAVQSGTAAATVVVVGGDSAVHGLALDTGAERWRTEIEGAGSPEVPPLPLSGSRVLVAHRLGGLVIVDADNGDAGWDISTTEAAVRPGPVGPSGLGSFALVLDDGRLLIANADGDSDLFAPPSLASGVAVLPSGWLVVSTTQGSANEVVALSGW